ncbi:MAG: hypothetical protein KAI72_06095 [Candidatus Pacebacteria bacterium]|nr:hypothetical protein [Candidatus Paceibacterota bacterium]
MSQDCKKTEEELLISDMGKFAMVIVGISTLVLGVTFFNGSVQNLKITSNNIPSSYNSSRIINNLGMMASVEKLDIPDSSNVEIVSSVVYDKVMVVLEEVNWFISKSYNAKPQKKAEE